jgi:CubicO group peptidase (beta-lactamase class C family)
MPEPSAGAPLHLVRTWPVPHVSAAVVRFADGSPASVVTEGDPTHQYRIASISKPITAWAALIAVEEGLLSLDTPVGQPGCTLRHLLAHAGGYAFDGETPISAPGKRRVYSNTGIELAAQALAEAAAMPFGDYLQQAVFEPLGMTHTELRGSPAYGIWSTVDDLVRFVAEVVSPRLVTEATARSAVTPVFPELAGIVPGVGRYRHNTWGLGFEVRDHKSPHWTGSRNSPATFGHFGGAGTLLWVDPGEAFDRAIACIALTDRSFDEWSAEALQLWPALSDAVLTEAG